MDAEEAKAFLKDRGIPTMNYPHGYLVKVSRREGSPSRRIEMDELYVNLALGKVTLIAIEVQVRLVATSLVTSMQGVYQYYFHLLFDLILK